MNKQTSSRKRAGKRRSGRVGVPLSLEGIEFTLPADLGIEHAAALHTNLSPLLATLEPVKLVARDVSRVHTASLQVLAAFVRERTSAGGPTHWRDAPALLRESATRIGLDVALGLTVTSSN